MLCVLSRRRASFPATAHRPRLRSSLPANTLKVLAFDKFNKKEIVMPEDMQHKTGRRGTILASKKKAAAGADGKTESKACVVS